MITSTSAVSPSRTSSDNKTEVPKTIQNVQDVAKKITLGSQRGISPQRVLPPPLPKGDLPKILPKTLSKPPPSFFIPLKRSTFGYGGYFKSREILKIKKIDDKEGNEKTRRKKIEKADPHKLLNEISFDVKLSANMLFEKKPTALKEANSYSDEIQEKIIKELSRVFNDCDPRILRRLSLPIGFITLTSPKTLSPNGIPCTLYISDQAIKTCIVPALNAISPNAPFFLDFAHCLIEENGLVELIRNISLIRPRPTIRISRPLTELEIKLQEVRVHESIKSVEYELDYDEKAFTTYAKRFIEPFYFVSKVCEIEGDLEKHLLIEEYCFIELVKKIYYKDIKDLYYHNGILEQHEIQRSRYRRLSLENFESQIPKENAISQKQKPLPPIPKQISKWKPAASKVSLLEQANNFFTQNQLDQATLTYEKALQEAETSNNKIEISDCLKGIGQIFLEKKYWKKAAHFLNAALVYCDQDEMRKNLIHQLINQIEERFIYFEFGREIPPKDPSILTLRRSQLNQIRNDSFDEFSTAPERMKNFSNKLSNFLESEFDDICKLLKRPPCAYAFLALGSWARHEMCPYSDIEFAVLLEEDSKDTREWFRKAIELLEMRVINLGETEHKILKKMSFSLTPRGFSFDSGGNHPLSKEELMTTPQKLAQLQSPLVYNSDLLLTNTTRRSRFIFGSRTLFEKYEYEKKAILDGTQNEKALSMRQERAKDIIKGHLKQFKPRFNQGKDKPLAYNVKEDLLRLPMFLFHGLADYYGCDDLNIWEIIKTCGNEEMVIRLFLSLFELRIACHLHYKCECDLVFYPTEDIQQIEIKNPYILDEIQIKNLIKIYEMIFYQFFFFQEFCDKPDSYRIPALGQGYLFLEWRDKEEYRLSLVNKK